MPIGRQLEGGAVKIETAEEIRQTLAIVLIPNNGPLREKIGGVGISSAIGHRPGKKLAMTVERDRPPGDGRFINGGGDLERLLFGNQSGA